MAGGAIALAALAAAPGASADRTIGPDVTQMPSTKGTCAFNDPAGRPCVIFATALPTGRLLSSPCDGTLTRFRLNGFVRPNNHYRLRVVRDNGNGTYTGTATSAQISVAAEGVNEYATSLPIRAGEYIAIDFQDSTEEFGLRWIGTFPSASSLVFKPFAADGTPTSGGFPDSIYYLFNADVQCPGEGPPAPAPPAPSNEFTVLGVKGTTLSVEVKSAGAVSVVDAGSQAKAKKRAAAAKKRGKPKLLKPSGASGGPGEVKVPLKLTGSAKKRLREKGKVKVKAAITFAPTGGTPAAQTVKLTVKKPKKRK